MKNIPDNSIDSVITDPPYELGFMGKQWDSKGIAFSVELWKEILRISKPGATLLCFGGTRTWHRLAVAIEDAGWIIKDTLMWLYGSGFPKSLNIGKEVDKRLGNEREVLKTRSGAIQKGSVNWQGQDRSNGKGSGFREKFIDTKGNTEWEGYGTSLKPAYEPIIMAMKPNEGSYVDNALKWGVGGLNIDGGRIVTNEKLGRPQSNQKFFKGLNNNKYNENSDIKGGRFPANLILDEESAEMLDKQSGISKSTGGRIGKKDKTLIDFGLSGKYQKGDPGYGDIGGASRFFYIAKVSTNERTLNGKIKNNHPTVKSLKLIEYLSLLTKTPSGGIVLDPFAGSGTTGVACRNTGRDYILIEKESEYIEIIDKRLNIKQGLFVD